MFTPKNSNNFMLIVVAAMLGLHFIIAIAVVFIYVVQYTINPGAATSDLVDIIPLWALVALPQVFTFGIPSAIYLIIKRKNIKEILPMRWLGWKNVLMIIGMTLAIQPLGMLINLVSQFVFPNVIGETIDGIGQEGGLLLMLLIIGVLPSIFEEVAFRGMGFVGFKRVKIHKAALINGMIFGMMHMNMNQFFYTFFLGMVFCYFMYYTKSIWAPILAHFVLNGTQSVLAYLVLNIDAEWLEYADSATYSDTAGMISAAIFFGFLALVFTGAFIAIFILFRQYNTKRNDAEGIITDTSILAEGEVPPKAFTGAVWGIIGIFAFMMALTYLLPVLMDNLGVAAGL